LISELINRKAVKAAIVLLPLLGITNVLVMVEAPLEGSTLEFALWSYSSHFLTSFQGFFVALLYCFLNGEVKSDLLLLHGAVKRWRRSGPTEGE
jgi:PDF receptor